jgi:hypothetical protein
MGWVSEHRSSRNTTLDIPDHGSGAEFGAVVRNTKSEMDKTDAPGANPYAEKFGRRLDSAAMTTPWTANVSTVCPVRSVARKFPAVPVNAVSPVSGKKRVRGVSSDAVRDSGRIDSNSFSGVTRHVGNPRDRSAPAAWHAVGPFPKINMVFFKFVSLFGQDEPLAPVEPEPGGSGGQGRGSWIVRTA